MQQELRRLAHGTHEEKQAEHGQRVRLPGEELHWLSGHAGSGGKHRIEIDCLESDETAEDTKSKTEVTHAIDDERLHGGCICRVARVPEADQKVRSQANAFPAEEHLDEVVGRHQHQHGEGEQREIGKKTRLMLVVAHVAERIDVDEC